MRTTKISRMPRLIFQCVRSPSATRLHLFVLPFLLATNALHSTLASPEILAHVNIRVTIIAHMPTTGKPNGLDWWVCVADRL